MDKYIKTLEQKIIELEEQKRKAIEEVERCLTKIEELEENVRDLMILLGEEGIDYEYIDYDEEKFI